MRLRILASATTIALAIGLLSAAPASATYTVTATFPGGGTEFYSPFDGPARIRFTFEPSDPARLYRVRLRNVISKAVLKTSFFSINPASQTSPVVRSFSWPALSTTTDRPYEVLVNPNGAGPTQSFAFVLMPRLVRVTGATPNPFFPWVDDQYKDTTRVKFSLAANADAEAHVWKANLAGNCCGSKVLDVAIGNNLPAGPNMWVWDGRGEAEHGTGGFRPKGSYFVKIKADDGSTSPALSKPWKLRIERTYRATATKTKPGTQYARTTESALVRGGDCLLHNLGALQVDCHGARITVYYRWGLNSVQRIEKASFVIDNSENKCGLSRRKTGHTKHESFITVTDAVSGITSCRIVTAKITYSTPVQS